MQISIQETSHFSFVQHHATSGEMRLPVSLILLAQLTAPAVGHISHLTQVPLHSNDPINGEDRSCLLLSPLLCLHMRLIEHESITGNEKGVGDWLASYLEKAGLTVQKQEVSKDRFNVLAYPGDDPKTDILVTSHIDTVPPYWDYKYKSKGKDTHPDNRGSDEIWGRGSVDAKACVAAQTIAVLQLLKDGAVSAKDGLSHKPSVSLLFVVGEETTGDGMKYFSAHKPHNYSAVIFGEPTEGKLASGHKGMLGFSIHVKGKAAHSGYPWLGVSANNVLVEALAKLQVIEEWLPSSDKYGLTTVNVGRIEGGVAANVVAEEAFAKLAVRIADETPAVVKKLIEDGLASTVDETEKKGGKMWFEYTVEGYPPVDIDDDIDGFNSTTVNYGTDVPNLEGNHKRYLYGPGSIFVAHSDHEHLKRGELERAVVDYKKIIETVSTRL